MKLEKSISMHLHVFQQSYKGQVMTDTKSPNASHFTLHAPWISESYIKMKNNLKFYFHTSLFNFFSSSGIGTEGLRILIDYLN